MDRLEGIKIFVRVVESGSFSAVARELGTGQPVISKQIAALEEHLGAQLLVRTSRSLSLTEAGRDFYESAVRLISDLEAAESRVGSGQASTCRGMDHCVKSNPNFSAIERREKNSYWDLASDNRPLAALLIRNWRSNAPR